MTSIYVNFNFKLLQYNCTALEENLQTICIIHDIPSDISSKHQYTDIHVHYIYIITQNLKLMAIINTLSKIFNI